MLKCKIFLKYKYRILISFITFTFDPIRTEIRLRYSKCLLVYIMDIKNKEVKLIFNIVSECNFLLEKKYQKVLIYFHLT